MKIHYLHSFAVTCREASIIQESLREKVQLNNDLAGVPTLIAGADISYTRHSDLFFASVILHRYPTLEIIEETYAAEKVGFPYIPGLLTFREGPPLLEAFAKLRQTPDLVIFDGQGTAHPRGMGLASHLGLFLDIPTIGCAKSRLVGRHDEPGINPGDFAPLIHEGKVVGAALRTKHRVKPVFVSPGHKISLDRALDITLSCCRGYRLPTPVRNAHLAVNKYRQTQLSRESEFTHG